MNKTMLTTVTVLTIVVVAVASWVIRDNSRIERELVTMMEERTTFSDEEVDRLWHWRTSQQTSKRFEELYARKIKHLPGYNK